jgi:uncharacterized membrane protein YgaE (UPF0421/DUF939 family)
MTKLQLALLAAGLLGSALHAYVTQSQTTFSKKSIVDVVIGGLAALLIPTYLPSLIPAGSDIASTFAIVAVISYTSSDIVQNVLGKLGVSIQGGTPPAPK